eukprot:gene14382-25916_t
MLSIFLLGAATVLAGCTDEDCSDLQQLTVDPSSSYQTYNGNGGLSAGASSRLLFDYAPAIRDEVLDYLYKPKFGASLQVCKDDLNCTRGYEFWLMKEAKRRNPAVQTWGLAWGAPGWINNQTGFYGPDLITYQVNWLKCARDYHQIDVDYLGLWNEMPWGSAEYVKGLKKAMKAENIATRLILGEQSKGGMPPVLEYKNDTEFMAAFDGVGLHYPCTVGSEHDVGPELLAAGKVLWASEDLWSEADWPGAACWAKTFNQNFIRMNLTSTVAWSTVWSAYPKVDLFGGIHNATTRGDPGISADGYWGPGLMYAWQPWSGYYIVPPTVWASAHTTQFVEPGWKMLHTGSGNLAAGGSYVSYLSPNDDVGTTLDFSIVIETGHATCPVCAANDQADNAACIDKKPNDCKSDPICSFNVTDGGTCSTTKVASSVAQTLRIVLHGELGNSAVRTVNVWHSNNSTKSFVNTGTTAVANGEFVLTVEPESIYTITTTTGQQRGGFPKPPAASAPFPTTWKDGFDGSVVESPPKYWADQCGSFQIMPSGGGRAGNSILQRVTMHPGKNKWHENLQNPLTLLGDPLANGATKVSVDVRVPAAAFPQPPPPPPTPPPRWHPAPAPPPSGAWVGLCGRVSSVGHNQNMGGVYNGICLLANATTPNGGVGWRVVLGNQTNGTQTLAKGEPFQASIDGVVVASGSTNLTAGMAALSSGWHLAEFDQFALEPGSVDELNTMRTFGTGKSEFLITPEETVLFNYNVSAPESYGVFTHFWITGSPAGGGGSDNATVRYYIDGEETASIEFKPPLATGVGFDDLAVWGTEKAAKVTLQHWTAPNSTAPQIGYAIVRGAENIPIKVGDLELPGASARLALHKIESVTYQPLACTDTIRILKCFQT